MILNRNEKEALWNLFQGGQANGEEMIDAVIAEVIKRLAAGVSVEPVAVVVAKSYRKYDEGSDTISENLFPGEQLFTLDQLTTAIAAARVQENEACITAVDKYWEENGDVQAESPSCVLRALLGKELT